LIQFGVCYGVEQVMMMSVLLVLSWCWLGLTSSL
jgi:hypothetical protein